LTKPCTSGGLHSTEQAAAEAIGEGVRRRVAEAMEAEVEAGKGTTKGRRTRHASRDKGRVIPKEEGWRKKTKNKKEGRREGI